MDSSPPCVKREPKIYLSVSLKFFLISVKHLGLWNSFKFFVSLNRFPNPFLFSTLKKKVFVCICSCRYVFIFLQETDQRPRLWTSWGGQATRAGAPSTCRPRHGQTKLILRPCLPAPCFCQDLSCVVFLYFSSSKPAPHTAWVPPGFRGLSVPFLHMWKNAEFF